MKRGIQTAAIILAVGLIGYFSYTFIMSWHEKELEVARMQFQEEMALPESPAVSSEKLIKAFGEDSSESIKKDTPLSLEEVERRVMSFFSYLDSQEYVKSYELEKGMHHQFQQTIKQLIASPPVVIGETESLYTLYKNMSHFYKVLGIKRINLIKDILNNESEILESAAKNFYLWFTIDDNVSAKIQKRPSLEVLYEYSGFFLNTLSGKSYLLRRETKVRILTIYYCVRILDKANDAELNAHGIDIRPHIKSLMTDINNQIGLFDKEHYLSELENLDEKYQL